MKTSDRESSLFWLGFSLFILIESYRLGIGRPQDPGMGFIAFGASGLLGVLSLALFFRTVFKRKKLRTESARAPAPWKKIIFVVIALLVYGSLMPVAGYLIGTFLLMVILFWVAEGGKWWGILVSSFLTTSITYLVFSKWLGCQFPAGLFGP